MKWTCFFRHWRYIVIETWYPGDEGEYRCRKCAPSNQRARVEPERFPRMTETKNKETERW